MICAEHQSKSFAVSAIPFGVRGTDILPRLGKSGRTQAALGRHLDLSVHAVGRLVRNSKELPPSLAAKIEDFFGGAPESPAAPATMTIPVFGYVGAGGDDRIALASDQILDELELPVGMIRGPAMGLRVAGDSMEPRLRSGETVIVGLNVPPHRNGDCVVELNDGTGLVKEYRGQRDGVVFLWQYNPEREVRVEASKVRAVHAVLWRR